GGPIVRGPLAKSRAPVRTEFRAPGVLVPKALIVSTVCAFDTDELKYGRNAYSAPLAVASTQMPLSEKPVVNTPPTARVACAVMPVQAGSPLLRTMTRVLSLNVAPLATMYVVPPLPTTVTAPVVEFTVTRLVLRDAYVVLPATAFPY